MTTAPSTQGVPVTLRSVSKVYSSRRGSVAALEEINLDIRPGEFMSILGPSGCGKSTLLHLIGGLTALTSGTIQVDESTVSEPVTSLGIVFQDALLLDWRTAFDNVMLQIEARKLDRKAYRQRAHDLLAQVGLEGFEDRLPFELSGGMRQRVALCRALVHDPPLLLMDEPFGPLDALTREQLMLDLHRLWHSTRQTVVFVTHSIQEAIFLSDRVVVMSPRPGRIMDVIDIALGEQRSLKDQTSPEFTKHESTIYQIFRAEGVFAE